MMKFFRKQAPALQQAPHLGAHHATSETATHRPGSAETTSAKDVEHSDYSKRVAAEISNFEDALAAGGVTHSIPKMFTWWASTYLRPRLVDVFGAADIPDIFANEILRLAKAQSKSKIRILSLGSGDCVFERSVHSRIDKAVDAHWVCTDLNPAVVKHAQNEFRAAGLDRNFDIQAVDLNTSFVDGMYDVIIANHSLHHFLNLEYIFAEAEKHLESAGRFLVSDMIGRNGHMRWPEALMFVQSFWAFLPERFRFNNHARCYEGREFNNYDCTSNGDFEGVRAQDILPLLVQRFKFERFVGFGNLPDVFLDRAYGHNFDPDSEFDRNFIELLEELNDKLIDSGFIKPTMMIATLTKDEVDPVYDRWSAPFCVRTPT
jgi:SAM-dependent methyltransferase